MKISRNIILAAIFMLAFVTRVFAATEVTSITASPGTFNPIINESTTITVQATPGVTGLEVRVLLPDQITVVRNGLALTEITPGTYTTTWDGKNDSNTGVVAGNYSIRVFNPGTTTYIGPWSEITVAGLSISPSIFAPTGMNAAMITVQATSGQTGMKARVYGNSFSYGWWLDTNGNADIPLTETTVGTYTATWNGIFGYAYYGGPYIAGDSTYTVYVYDAGGNQSTTTGQIIIKGVSQVSVSPSQFSAMSGGTATITATGVAGLNLQAKAKKYNSTTNKYDAIRTLPMTGTGTTYTATWDGKDDSGNVTSVGSYTIEVWHTGSSGRYYPQGSVQVSVGVTSITPSPSTFTPTGTNVATIAVQATSGQTGMKARVYGNSFSYGWWLDTNGNADIPLTETTVGTYTATWNGIFGYAYYGGPYIAGDSTYTVYVYDAGGNQSTTTGQIIIKGVSQVSVSPSQFSAMSGGTATITATGVAGLNLQAKAKKYNSTTNKYDAIRTLPMTGTGTTYTATWDGKDDSGNVASVGSYTIEVWHTGSSGRYYPQGSVQVSVGVTSITPSPSTFTPTGTNVATIAVQATSGQTGMKARVYGNSFSYGWWLDTNGNADIPLTETTVGTYTATWNGIFGYAYYGGPYIAGDSTYTVYVYDAGGNQSTTTGQIIIKGVSQVSVSPSQFSAMSGGTATITATGVAGLNLQAKAKKYNSTTNKYDAIRTLPMTGTGTTYTATWDGKDDSGNVASVGSYTIEVWHTGSSGRYYPQGSVQVSVGVTSITPSPSTFTPTGTNVATIAVQATSGQTGMKARVYGNSFSYGWWLDTNGNADIPLTETTVGTYTATWNGIFGYAYYGGPYIAGDSTYTVYVYDAGGNQSTTTGQIIIKGVSQVSASPNQFTPGGNNYTTITAKGAVGQLFDARIYNATTSALTRVLPFTEVNGNYTADWDGKDTFGNFAGANNYTIQISAKDSSIRYYLTTSVKVNVAVFTISASPDPFIPDGVNSTTITVRADALQSGLKATISHPQSGTSAQLPLREAGSAGTYTTTWDGKINGAIPRDGICTIRVYDSGGNLFPATGTFTLSSAKSLTATPSPFEITGTSITTISAQMPSGLHLEARIGALKTLSLTEASGTYSAVWDGRDGTGKYFPPGTYPITIWNTDTLVKYDLEFIVQTTLAIVDLNYGLVSYLKFDNCNIVDSAGNQTVITVDGNKQCSSGIIGESLYFDGESTQLNIKNSTDINGSYTVSMWMNYEMQPHRIWIATLGNPAYTCNNNGMHMLINVNGEQALQDGIAQFGFFCGAQNTFNISSYKNKWVNVTTRYDKYEKKLQTFINGVIAFTETVINAPIIENGEIRFGYVPDLWRNESRFKGSLDEIRIYDRALSDNELLKLLPNAESDSVAPDTNLVNGPVENSFVATGNVLFQWTGSDNLPWNLSFSYKLDDNLWSNFSSIKEVSFQNLSEGPHVFMVKAKDLAGNEDPTPAVRHFTVDGSPPQPAVNLTATPTQTGIRLDWTHSPSADVYSYKLYWDNGTGTINYAAPFATIYYPAKTFTASIFKEGTYKYALRAVDKAGNEEQNTDLIASATISGFSVSVDTTGSVHKRGDDVPITGSVLASDSIPLVNVPVAIEVESKGYVRTYSAFTKANGGFSYLFQPLVSEAGSYTVKARVLYQGLEKSATSFFSIIGMLMEPGQVTIDMSMNSPKTVNINLRNIGSTAMSELQYTLVDSDLSDPVKGFIDTASLPTSLAAGASAVIPVLITSDPGTPPSVPAVFTLNVASSDGITESAKITARLHDAVSLPVVNPDPIMVGVRTGEPVTKTVTITNQGYATMLDSTLTVHDPATYGWVSIPNGTFGIFNPQEAKSCQIVVNPPEGTTLGTYVVQLDLKYNNGTTKPVYMTVEVTTSTVGQVAFKVHDDTGSVVSGAEVNLISKAFYVNVTPNGRQEYNSVLKGTTNAQGYILFSDVPAGDYRYVVNAVRHDQKDGPVNVEPGSTPQTIGVIMVTNLVNVDFSVTQTTIQDQYTVNLNITYVTDLIKPNLFVAPYRVDLSFFPEDSPSQGALTITNTSNNAPVRNLTLDATELNQSDNEIRIVFDDGTVDGTQKITLGELGFGKSIQVPYKAIIFGTNPKLNNRNLGNIIASAEFDLSIDGKTEKSTTKTPIPVLYWKPQELGLPGISYLNDETNNQTCNLQYQGNTYRLSVKSNRNMSIALDTLKAVNQVNGGPDAASIISSNSAIWTGSFTPTTLSAKGMIATFDIDDLTSSLESRCNSDRSNFLGKPNYIGFTGTWSDRNPNKDAYLIPVSIITKTNSGIYIGDSTPGGGGWVGGTVPTFNEHGTVKMQIDQKVSLEREAFNAKLSIKPSVTPLDNFKAKVSIKDNNGDDASGFFFVVVTQKTGIASVDGSSVSGPVDITWQLIPNSNAGGTTAEGKNYSISATIDYNFSGGSYTFATQPETITVKPMPKLTIDYKLPYVIMAGKPVKIKAVVKNNGYGIAHNLKIESAQPKILENLNNIPVLFTMNGSSSTIDGSGYIAGGITINFGDIPPGGSAEGYWLLNTTKNGYFVEFTSSFTHQNYLGVQLDPLIEKTTTQLVPAVGGEIFNIPNPSEGMKVVLTRDGISKEDIVNAWGNYYFQELVDGEDLAAGNYKWELKKSIGDLVVAQDITVLAEQPTAHVNYGTPDKIAYTSFVPLSETAKKLILITHGWNASTEINKDGTESWPNEMVKNICSKFGAQLNYVGRIAWCSNDEWEVRSFDWKEAAAVPVFPALYPGPMGAYVNARSIGTKLGNDILLLEALGRKYEHIHFIAHSAGSNLINNATMVVKSKSSAIIQTTFLDAYDPNGFMSIYGISSDWSEQYVDKRELVLFKDNAILSIFGILGGPILNDISETVEFVKAIDTTDTDLMFSFNVDVTNRDIRTEPNPITQAMDLAQFRHGWPYVYYEDTIKTTNSIGYTYYNESDINWTSVGEGANKYYGPVKNNEIIYPKGSACALTASIDSDINSCGCKISDYLNNACAKTNNSPEKIYDDLISILLFNSISGIVEVAENELTLHTRSPVWSSYQFNIESNKNVLQFNYEYLTTSIGMLSVYVDGNLVYKVDESVYESGVNNTGDIAIGNIKPGSHVITYRLDTFDGTRSSVKITNARIGLIKLPSKPASDVTKPISNIQTPSNSETVVGPQLGINGISDDGAGSGVKTVEVSLDGGSTWLLANGTTSWQYLWNIPASGTYTVLSRATDNAGNVEVPSSGVTFTVSLPDLVAPTGSIAIQAVDNYTKSTVVTLAIAANDPSGVSQMCISNTETCTDWQTFAQSLPWQLTTGDGLKTVRAWFRDGVGNSNTQPYSASVTLDMTAPTLTLFTLKNGASTNNATLNIPGTVTDNSGVKTLIINDNLVQIKSDNSFSYALPLPVGPNTVKTVATDLAGNSTTDTRVIIYDPNAPILIITGPVDNSRTNKSFIDVTGTIDENATVKVKVNTGQPELAAITDNNFTYTANLLSGSNTIEVIATDLAENVAHAKRTVIYDDLKPSLAITAPAQDITTSQNTILLKGTVSDTLTAVTVTINVDNQTFKPPVVNGVFEQTITFATAKSYGFAS